MYLLYIRGLHGGADKAIREIAPELLTVSFGCRTRKRPSIGVPAKRRSVGSPPKEFSVGSKRARFVGKRSNRAQANEKPLFQAAFLQFSANCDAGAYRDVCEHPRRDLDAVSRKIARDGVPHVLSRNGTLNRLIRMRCAKAPPCRTRGVLVVHKRSARRG